MLTGVTAALVTPLDERGRLDEAAVERLVARVLAGGVDALSPTGSTGEGARLSQEQRVATARLVRSLAPAETPVVSGIAYGAVDEALTELELLAGEGVSAALVPPPAYYPLSDEEVTRLYRTLAERSPIPLVLYNIPVFTKVRIDPAAVVGELARLPAVVAIKDSSRDMEYLQQVLAHTRDAPHFTVLTGTDTLLLASLVLGVHGTVCASANLAPDLAVGVHRAFTAGDLDTSAARQHRLAELVAACRRGSFPAGWKAALDLAGVCGPHLAPPATPLPGPDRDVLARRLAELLPGGLPSEV